MEKGKLKAEKKEVRVEPMERIPHSISEQGLLGDQDLPVFQDTQHPGGLKLKRKTQTDTL